MFWARQLLAKSMLFPIRAVLHQGKGASGAKFQHGLHTFSQSLSITLSGNNAIQDRFNGVQFVAANGKWIFAASFKRLADVDQFSIHTRAHQALFLQSFKHIFMKSFARANHGGRQHDAFAGKCIKNGVRDLRGAHGGDFPAANFSVAVAVPTCWRAATRP